MSQETPVDREGDWFADESFWEWSYSLMFPPSRFAQAPEEVEQVLKLTGRQSGRVLDLACGPGRHSVELAQRGFRVTGVDRSAFLLGHARERGTEVGVDVEWVEKDMRAFRRPGSFDLALSIFTSFGYFDPAEENQQVLQNVCESLVPGGAFVIHVMGKEPLAKRFVGTDYTELGDGSVLIQHREVEADWTRLRSTWLMLRDGATESFAHRVWIYSGSELRRMLLDAGFESVALYGAFDGRAYDLDAQRLVAVAKKPD